jgi:gluconolactonase
MSPVAVAKADSYLEGPVFDRAGNLYVSSLTSVLKISGGTVGVWLGDAEAGYNGHKILPNGDHLICEMNKHAVWRYNARGESLGAAAAESEGVALRAPNDIILDGVGGWYFTDPGGSRTEPIGTVHYARSGGEVSTIAGGMKVPNGLALSRTHLYVAETVPNRILRFELLAPGKLGALDVFAELPGREGYEAAPDGLVLDRAGNLYVAHLGTGLVLVLNPRGRLIARHETGLHDASNLCWRERFLYVTGSIGHRRNSPGQVVRLDMSRQSYAL